MSDDPNVSDATGKRGHTRARNKGRRIVAGNWPRRSIYACLIALVIRTFLFQPFNIPSASMEATCWSATICSSRNSPTAIAATPSRSAARPFCDVHGRSLARGPAARRRHRVQAAASDQFHRLHQAADRPAGRPHPDDQRRPLPQRQAGAARCAWPTMSRPDGLAARTMSHQYRETLPGGKSLSDAGPDPESEAGQHRGVHRAARPLLHDGRQPRQFGRQPRSSGLCSGRKSGRQGGIPLLLHRWNTQSGTNSGPGPAQIRYGRMFTLID